MALSSKGHPLIIIQLTESHVKIAKCILQKCNGNYEEFLDGLARYRNIPRAATHKSPAGLFFLDSYVSQI